MIGSPLTSFCHSEVWQADRQQRSSALNAIADYSIVNSLPMQGFLSSPITNKERADMTVMSPADSNLMFSLPHSPSHPQKAFEMLAKQDNDLLMSTFSPSIFSPPDKRILSRNKLEGGFSSSGMYIDSPDIFNLDEDRGEEEETLLNESDIETENESEESFSMGTTPIKSSSASMSLKFTKLNVKRTSVVESANSRKKSSKFSSFVTPDSSNSSSLISPENHDHSISRKLSITSNQGIVHNNSNNNLKKNSARHIRDISRQRQVDSSFSQNGKEQIDQEENEDQEDDDDDDDDENESSSNSVKALKLNANFSNNNNNSNTIVSCNCKKSKCLKLYCDCFAILRHCDSRYCRCVSCCNTMTHETLRNNAIKTVKERNSRAFRLKINEEEQQHVSGCHCKNSRCLKKYCECFTANALCGANCKCLSCDNYSGSEELLKIRKLSPLTPGASSSVFHTPSPSAAATISTSSSSVTATVSSLPLSTVSSTGLATHNNNNNNNSNNNSSKKRKDSPNSVAALLDNSPSLSHTPANNTHNKAVFSSSSSSSSYYNSTMQHVQHAPPLKKLHATHLTPNTQQSSQNNHNHNHNSHHNSSIIIQSQPLSGHTMLTTPTTSQHLLVPVKVTTRSSTICKQNQPIPAQSHSFDEPLQRPSQRTSSNTSSPDSNTSSVAGRTRAKNKRVRFATTMPVTYQFFGPDLPQTSKFIALKCLDYLSCSDLYTMSTVNSLWCSAATDEALWE